MLRRAAAIVEGKKGENMSVLAGKSGGNQPRHLDNQTDRSPHSSVSGSPPRRTAPRRAAIGQGHRTRFPSSELGASFTPLYSHPAPDPRHERFSASGLCGSSDRSPLRHPLNKGLRYICGCTLLSPFCATHLPPDLALCLGKLQKYTHVA